MARWAERQLVLLSISLGGWMYIESRRLLHWAHSRRDCLDTEKQS